MFNLIGLNAVIIGAVRSIGLQIAKRLVEDGVSGVALLDNDYSLVTKAAAGLGLKAFPVLCNICSREDVDASFSKVYEKFGHIDICIICLDMTSDVTIIDMSNEQWNYVGTCLDSSFYCVKNVAEKMKDQANGRIISVLLTDDESQDNNIRASVVRSGMTGFMRALDYELASYGVTVNAVCSIVDHDASELSAPHESVPAALSVRKTGSETTASIISFLATDDGRYMNGNCFVVSKSRLIDKPAETVHKFNSIYNFYKY